MTRPTRLLPALLVAVTLVALAACGTDAPTRSSDGPEPQRLSVQAAGGQGELAAVQELVDAFERTHPGVEVTLTGVPSQGDHIAKLAASFAGGRPPDVFLLNYRRLGQFVAKDVLLPPASPDVGGLYPQPVEAFTYDGRPACLPTNASSTVAYVNEDLFRRAGLPLPASTWTWTDLETAAAALHRRGIAAVGFEPGIRTVAPFVWTAGGEVVDDTAAPTRMTLDTPPARAALTFLDRLQRFGVDATSRAARDPVEQFTAGELAVFFDSRRSVPAFRKAEGLRFDVRPLPRSDASVPSTSLLASDAYCVARATASPRLAAQLAEFAVRGEGATILARSGRTVPVLRSLAAGPDFLAPDQDPRSSTVFLDAVPLTKRLPNVAGEDEAEEAADDLLEQLFAGKADLDRTVRTIGEDTAAVYRRER